MEFEILLERKDCYQGEKKTRERGSWVFLKPSNRQKPEGRHSALRAFPRYLCPLSGDFMVIDTLSRNHNLWKKTEGTQVP